MAVTPDRPSAGEARTLVVVEKQRREEDDQGGYSGVSYTEVDRGYAAVEAISAGEQRRMGREDAEVSHMVRFREPVDVPTNGRLRLPQRDQELYVDTVLRDRPDDPPAVQATRSSDHATRG